MSYISAPARRVVNVPPKDDELFDDEYVRVGVEYVEVVGVVVRLCVLKERVVLVGEVVFGVLLELYVVVVVVGLGVLRVLDVLNVRVDELEELLYDELLDELLNHELRDDDEKLLLAASTIDAVDIRIIRSREM